MKREGRTSKDSWMEGGGGGSPEGVATVLEMRKNQKEWRGFALEVQEIEWRESKGKTEDGELSKKGTGR